MIPTASMIDEVAASIPIWMVLSAAFGFVVGDGFGESIGRRKCLEEANQDLRAQLKKVHRDDESLHRELKQQRGVINDIHKRVVAVSKGLGKPTS
jgi:hypothetical protein